jgi:hypothetical protein
MFRIINQARIESPVRIINGQTQSQMGHRFDESLRCVVLQLKLNALLPENSVVKRRVCPCPNEKRLFERANLVCANWLGEP